MGRLFSAVRRIAPCLLMVNTHEHKGVQLMKKTAVLFATGYEEVEALTVVDLLSRPGAHVDVSDHIFSSLIPSVDKGKHGLQRPAKRLRSLSSLTYGK